MKHTLTTILISISVLFIIASCVTNNDKVKPPAKAQKSIVILFEGDTHCETSGYSRFAGLRDAMKQADTAHVVTVSLGDFMVGGALGAISKGLPSAIMNLTTVEKT